MSKYFHFLVIILLICLWSACENREKKSSNSSDNPNDPVHQKIVRAEKLIPDNMDSAFILLQESEQVEKDEHTVRQADYYNAYGFYYWYMGEPDKAIGMFKKNTTLELTDDLLKQKAMAANNIGTLYNQTGIPDSALKYLEISLHFDTERGNENGVMKTNFDLGVYYSHNDQYEMALKYLTKSFEFYKRNNEGKYLIYVFNALGNVYFKLDSFNIAIGLYKEGAELSRKMNNLQNEALAYSNLIAIYNKKTESFDSTIYYGQKGLELAEKMGDSTLMLTINTNIGLAYQNIGQFNKALQYFGTAEALISAKTNPLLKSGLLIYLGDVYISLGNVKQAIDYFKSGLNLAREIQSLSGQKDALLGLAVVDSVNNDFKLANQHLNEAMNLQNRILNEETNSRIARFQIIYDTEKKNNLITQLEARNKLNRLIIASIVLFSIMTVTILFISTLYFKKRNKLSTKLLDIKNLEADKLKARLDADRQELTGKALSLVQAEELIEKLKTDLKSLMNKSKGSSPEDYNSALKQIYSDESSQILWKEFENRFNTLNNGFISRLVEQYPNLSPAEIRMCAMLHLQLSSKEIAGLIRRSTRTIDFTRNSIRKKMNLSPNDNLTTHLLSI